MHQQNESTFNESEPNSAVVKKKSAASCIIYGCLFSFLLITLLIALLLLGGGYYGYRLLQDQLNQYTSKTPADLPVIEYTPEQWTTLKEKIEKFKKTAKQAKTPADLILTADDINALLAEDADMWHPGKDPLGRTIDFDRGTIHITIHDGQVSGNVSIPTDFLPGGKGRYFNASGTFDVFLADGVLVVTLASATVQDEILPTNFVEAMREENLTPDIYNQGETADLLRRLESLTIDDGKIILKSRVDEPVSTDPAKSQPDADGSRQDLENAATP
jgi:hypothetical protein